MVFQFRINFNLSLEQQQQQLRKKQRMFYAANFETLPRKRPIVISTAYAEMTFGLQTVVSEGPSKPHKKTDILWSRE
jgi:hypothetical protein